MEAALLESRFAELVAPEQIVTDRDSLSAYDSDLTENPLPHCSRRERGYA